MVSLTTAAQRVATLQGYKTPKMALVTETGYKVTVPFAPPSNSYSGIGREWARSDRAGRKARFRSTGLKNQVIEMDFFIGQQDAQANIWPIISAFISLANRKERLMLVYTRADAGLYQITDFSYEILDRRAYDHEPSRASISITFTWVASTTANTAKNPRRITAPKTSSSGKKTATKTTSSSSKTARTYKVVKGDSLWKIAVKFYKNGNLWRRIADANKIKNPNLIRPGQVLKIPAL